MNDGYDDAYAWKLLRRMAIGGGLAGVALWGLWLFACVAANGGLDDRHHR